MKRMIVYYFALILLTFPAHAFDEFHKKLNIDCLQGATNFTTKDEDGNYRDEPMYNISFMLREKDKYLILETNGPHVMWMLGNVILKLKKEKDHYIEKLINLKITPFCDTDELYIEFINQSYSGLLFKKVR